MGVKIAVGFLAGAVLFVTGYFAGKLSAEFDYSNSSEADKTKKPSGKSGSSTVGSGMRKATGTDRTFKGQSRGHPDIQEQPIAPAVSELTQKILNKQISVSEVMEMFRATNDPLKMDEIASAARNSGDPDLVRAFAHEALNNPDSAHRMYSVQVLTIFEDSDGTIRNALKQLILNEPALNVRLSALGGLSEFLSQRANARYFQEFFNDISGILKSDASSEIKTQALSGLPPKYLKPAEISEIGNAIVSTKDPSIVAEGARLLSEVRGESRQPALQVLGKLLQNAVDLPLKQQLIEAIVKVGRTDALPLLKSLTDGEISKDVQIYIKILESGEVDWQTIQELKSEAEGN